MAKTVKIKAVKSQENKAPIPTAVEAAKTAPVMGPSSAAVSASTGVIEKPAEAIRAGGNKFTELYEKYTTLRELARPLNGLSQGAVLPDNVQVNSVTLNFTVNGTQHSVELDTVRTIAEIAPILSIGIRAVIERMNTELFSLNHLVSGMQASIQQALSAKPAGVTLQNNNNNEKTL